MSLVPISTPQKHIKRTTYGGIKYTALLFLPFNYNQIHSHSQHKFTIRLNHMKLPFLHVKTGQVIGHLQWFNLKFTCLMNILVIPGWGVVALHKQSLLNKAFEKK